MDDGRERRHCADPKAVVVKINWLQLSCSIERPPEQVFQEEILPNCGISDVVCSIERVILKFREAFLIALSMDIIGGAGVDMLRRKS